MFRTLVLLLTLTLPMTASTASTLAWRARDQKVDADIERLSVTSLLNQIADATGWEIYLQPDITNAISARFSNLPSNQALQFLLAPLNFALLPQSNGLQRLTVYKTSPQAAVLIRPPRLEKKRGFLIPNELIVRIEPGESIETLARQLGAKILGRNDALDTYRLQFSTEAAMQSAREELASRDSVAAVDSNYLAENPPAAEPAGFTGSFPFTLKPTANGDPNHLIIGLIDSNIQKVGGAMQDFILSPLSVVDPPTTESASPTHATSMSETLLRGLAETADQSQQSKVRILPVDVYGDNKSTTTYDVANGIYKAVNNGATIINLSLGSYGDSRFLHSVIQSAHDQGVIFFAAAGNEPVATPTYPAAYPEVTAVTAGDRKGNVASYANYGAFVDVLAPGLTVVSYNNKLFFITGTSASTAYASGLAAGLADTSKKTLPQVEASIRKNLSFRSTR